MNDLDATEKTTRRAGDVAAIMIMIGLLARACLSSTIASAAGESFVVLLCAGGAAVSLLVDVRHRRSSRILGSSILWIATGAILVSFIAHQRDFQAARLATQWIALLFGAFALESLVREERRRRLAWSALLSTAVLLMLYGLAQRLWLFESLKERALAMMQGRTDEDVRAFVASLRARSTFGQANGFAAFLLFLLPIGLEGVSGTQQRKLGAAAFLGLIIAALFASGSKGGGVVAMTIVGVWLSRTTGRRAGHAVVVISALAVVGVVLGAFGILGDVAQSTTSTLRARFDYWMTAARMIGSAPWTGVGLDRYGEFADLHRAEGEEFSRHAHSMLLEVTAEMGVPLAVGVLAAAVLALMRRVRRVPESSAPAHSERTPTGSFLVAAAALLLAHVTTAVDRIEIFFVEVDDTAAFLLLNLAISTAILYFSGRYVLGGLIDRLMSCTAANRRVFLLAALGFGLHGAIDFDLRIPGAMTVLAGIMATASAGFPAERGRSAPWWIGATVAGTLVALAMAWQWRTTDIDRIERRLIAGMGREHLEEISRSLPDREMVFEIVRQAWRSKPDDPAVRSDLARRLAATSHSLGALPRHARILHLLRTP